MSLPTGLPMPWSWGEVRRGISTGVSHGPKLQERQRPVCKAAGFWELGCPAPSGGRSSIWQNIPTDHDSLSKGAVLYMPHLQGKGAYARYQSLPLPWT